MRMPRTITTIVAPVALVLGLAIGLQVLLTLRHGVVARCTDQGLRIYQTKFFPVGHFDAIFGPFTERLKLHVRLLLAKVGVPFQPVRGFGLHGEGPALVIYGHFEGKHPPRFCLVTEVGRAVNPWGADPTWDSRTGEFLWCQDAYGLSNGLYYVRDFGKTNNLADVRIGL
jgi:hypothetical protein